MYLTVNNEHPCKSFYVRDTGEYAQSYESAGSLTQLPVVDQNSWTIVFYGMIMNGRVVSAPPPGVYVLTVFGFKVILSHHNMFLFIVRTDPRALRRHCSILEHHSVRPVLGQSLIAFACIDIDTCWDHCSRCSVILRRHTVQECAWVDI